MGMVKAVQGIEERTMTQQPKYYLITPDELRRFYECALIHDMPDAPTIDAFIRSRQYTSAEKVLDGLIKKYEERIEIINNTQPGFWACPWINYKDLVKELKELRQRKERER
jgi:hypothetical protein